GLGVHVSKARHVGATIHDLRRNGTTRDFAENTRHKSPPVRLNRHALAADRSQRDSHAYTPRRGGNESDDLAFDRIVRNRSKSGRQDLIRKVARADDPDALVIVGESL